MLLLMPLTRASHYATKFIYIVSLINAYVRQLWRAVTRKDPSPQLTASQIITCLDYSLQTGDPIYIEVYSDTFSENTDSYCGFLVQNGRTLKLRTSNSNTVIINPAQIRYAIITSPALP